MPRKSESKIWSQNSKLHIIKFAKDIILHKETDEKGCVQTNKKLWNKFNATVILGTCKESNSFIEVPEDALIWTCKINSRGRLSAITHEGKTYSNEEVLVIIHAK